MTNTTITTHDIRIGDRIGDAGMLLLVDQAPKQTNHRVQTDSRGATFATAALIENWDALVAEAIEDRHSIAAFIVGRVRSDMRYCGLTEPRWTIQGNGWAKWARIN